MAGEVGEAGDGEAGDADEEVDDAEDGGEALGGGPGARRGAAGRVCEVVMGSPGLAGARRDLVIGRRRPRLQTNRAISS